MQIHLKNRAKIIYLVGSRTSNMSFLLK